MRITSNTTGCLKFVSVAILSMAVIGPVAQTASADIATIVPRNYYGAKFEPIDKVIHGGGQTYYLGGPLMNAFTNYANVTGPNAHPITYADYNNYLNTQSWYNGLNARLGLIESANNVSLVPQLGTVLPQSSLLTTTQVNNIVNGLASLGRPVFYRPGYESNGPWNGYDPTFFKQNFQLLSNAIRAADLPVAMVWNPVVGDFGSHSDFSNVMNYYPGDTYVDWWSFNVFGTVEFTPAKLAQKQLFLDEADLRGFPVLIGEATPQFEGAESAVDWTNWYDPFFDLIEHNPGIKAHTYINWDWSLTVEWPNWGDASLENAHPTVVSNYLDRITSDLFVHAGTDLPTFFDPIPGDLDGDGFVGLLDLDIVLNNWNQSVPPANPLADVAGPGGSGPDGFIGLDDLDVVLNNWNAGTPPVAAVPEPGAVTLLALTLPVLLRRKA